MSSTQQLPTTIEGFHRAMSQMMSAEGRERGLAFKPHPSDIIISPYSKSGTTWLQQMVHTLRTGGDIDHTDISSVVPWIEPAHDLGIDLTAAQRAEPRAFKSHCSWTTVPKGCKYIVCLRDPRDALVSLYHFLSGWFFEPGAFTVDEFAREHYLPRSDGRHYWHHLISWYEQRNNPNVMLLTFDGMLASPEKTIRRVAAFCDIELSEELLQTTLEQTSIEFMLAHKPLFADLLMRELSERACGLPPAADSSKVRTGKSGGHKAEISAEVLALFDQRWRETVGKTLGFECYEDLSASL
jgi:hypothetical protein